MILRAFFSGVPFVLVNLLAAYTGAGSGGGEAAPNPSDENKPAPAGKTLEEKLSSAKTTISQLFERAKSLAGLTKERDDAKAESTRLQQQFGAATAEATKAKSDLEGAKAELASAKADLSKVNGQLSTANTNVARLEKLCGVKGVGPSSDFDPALVRLAWFARRD
jgi:hypothetical protein